MTDTTAPSTPMTEAEREEFWERLYSEPGFAIWMANFRDSDTPITPVQGGMLVAIQAAILGANFGRHADTIACIAAGICGALSGVSPANAELIEHLPAETRRVQADLASRLAVVTRAKIESELKAIARCAMAAS